MNLKFSPYADECTTFEKVRLLRFYEASVEVNIVHEGEKKVFTNSKPFVIYFDTETLKVLNTLQEVRFTSEKLKVKCSLKDLEAASDIEINLKKWRENSKLTA